MKKQTIFSILHHGFAEVLYVFDIEVGMIISHQLVAIPFFLIIIIVITVIKHFK
jgi:hypothetical protein